MAVGKRLLIFSHGDPKATALNARTQEWGCMVTTAETADDMRGKIEGSEFDLVLVESSKTLKRLIAEADPNGEILRTPLSEIEKRHILRVLSSTNGNKTRAAKILGIDTKTLYNKLKAYGAAADASRKRSQGAMQASG